MRVIYLILSIFFIFYFDIITQAENINLNDQREDINIDNKCFEDWDKGMESAKKEKKPVIIYFTSEHCGSCRAMESRTFATSEIKERLARDWISIRIFTSCTTKRGTFDGNTLNYFQISRLFRVKWVPTCVFLDKGLKPVQSLVGYRGKDIFGPILDYMKDEAYTKGISFAEYREKHN